MSVNNFVAQVAPMNHAAKVALEQESSGIKQMAMQQLMPEILKRENEKVEKPAPGEAGQKVRQRDARERRRNGQQAGQRSAQPWDEISELFEGSDGEPADDVWAGNIVNVRI